MSRHYLACLATASALLTLLPRAVSAAPDSSAIPNCREQDISAPIPLTSHSATSEDYPPLSRLTNESGDTIADYVVLANGTVGDVTITRSSGSLRLDDATVDFVRRFQFKPAQRGGITISCRNQIDLRWSLTNLGSNASFWLMYHPSPAEFPPGAVERNEQAMIFALVYLDEAGAVTNVLLVRASSFADLNNATNAYIRAQKFKPSEINGKPVKTILTLGFDWSLHASAPPTGAPTTSDETTRSPQSTPKGGDRH